MNGLGNILKQAQDLTDSFKEKEKSDEELLALATKRQIHKLRVQLNKILPEAFYYGRYTVKVSSYSTLSMTVIGMPDYMKLYLYKDGVISIETLLRRCIYGGKKGQKAYKKLMSSAMFSYDPVNTKSSSAVKV